MSPFRFIESDAGLQILNVDVTDNAEYTCHARSQVSSVSASATLYVDGTLTTNLPNIGSSICRTGHQINYRSFTWNIIRIMVSYKD